ncbi:MAG: hypothetical protein WA063_06205 [Minisyncoccia bacterium]
MEFDFSNKSLEEIADEFIEIDTEEDQEKAMSEIRKLGPDIVDKVSKIILGE